MFNCVLSTSLAQINIQVSSIVYHTIDKHEWGGYKHFKCCAHERYTMEESRGREWLEEGSDAHKAIVSNFKDKKFKSDCKYLTEAIHTTNVEVFNNIILKYLPKQYHSEYDHMVMGTYLAALDNKFNSERGQDTIKSGENIGKYKYKIAWKKTSQSVWPENYIRKNTTEILK